MQHEILDDFDFSDGKNDSEIDWQRTETAVIGKFYDIFEAQMAASQLRAEGLPCFLANENSAVVMPHISTPIRLHVRSDDEWQAREILQEIAPKSSDNQQDSRRFNAQLWFVFAIVVGLILAMLFNLALASMR